MVLVADSATNSSLWVHLVGTISMVATGSYLKAMMRTPTVTTLSRRITETKTTRCTKTSTRWMMETVRTTTTSSLVLVVTRAPYRPPPRPKWMSVEFITITN